MRAFSGYFVDGVSAGRRAAEVRAEGGDLLIALDEGREVLRWPLADIRALRDQAGAAQMILRLETATDSEARLVMDDRDGIRWLLEVCSALDAHTRDPLGTRRMVIWAGGAVASFAGLLFVVIPGLAGWLAPMVPVATAEALGQQVRGQVSAFFTVGAPETRYCTNLAGVSALQAMADRLTQREALPYTLKLAVVDGDPVNAFAAPGGHVVVLRGLIDEANDAEEVAAVLAHEIGHVAARDPMRAAMRSAGSAGLLSLALGDFLGGGVLATVSTQLIDARYSRTAETAADAYAADLLIRAGVSPDALARFFDRLAESSGNGPSIPPYFASHPPLESRSAGLRDRAVPGWGRPILTDAEWRNLQDVCRRRGPTPDA